MGRKEPSQRSLGSRRGRCRGFSDCFSSSTLVIRLHSKPHQPTDP